MKERIKFIKYKMKNKEFFDWLETFDKEWHRNKKVKERELKLKKIIKKENGLQLNNRKINS